MFRLHCRFARSRREHPEQWTCRSARAPVIEEHGGGLFLWAGAGYSASGDGPSGLLEHLRKLVECVQRTWREARRLSAMLRYSSAGIRAFRLRRIQRDAKCFVRNENVASRAGSGRAASEGREIRSFPMLCFIAPTAECKSGILAGRRFRMRRPYWRLLGRVKLPACAGKCGKCLGACGSKDWRIYRTW